MYFNACKSTGSILIYVIDPRQILVVSICNTIPFRPFFLSTSLPFPHTLWIEITIMSKIHQIIMIAWFSRNRIFHWFFCLHCKNHCVQELREVENWKIYNENFVCFSRLIYLYPRNKIKWSCYPSYPTFISYHSI